MKRKFLLAANVMICVMLVGANYAIAQNWSQWRGPQSNGLTTAKKLPAEWGADKNIAWKVALPGAGWSQPIVWEGKIFITTAITENQRKPQAGDFNPIATADGPDVGFGFGRGPGGFRGRDDSNRDDSNREGPERRDPGEERRGPGGLGGPSDSSRERRGPGGFRGFGEPAPPPDKIYVWKVMCLDSGTGKVIWEGTAHSGKPRTTVNRNNTYASETPVTDGERVIAYFGNTGLFCYDISGKPLWSKDLGAYKMQMGWGTGSSPVLYGDRVFIQCDNEEKSFLVALNKKTGDELWRIERDELSNWSTPYIWKNKQRTELVVAGGTKLQSHDPENGKLLWEMDAGGRNSLTPVGDEEYLYADSVDRRMGGRGPIVAVRVGASGDISLKDGETSNEYVAWSVPLRTFRVSSPLLYEGCLYMLDQQRGQIRCYDAKTGKENYTERLQGARGFSSSPWASDGKVFCLDETGLTFVLKAGPEFEVLATNELDETFWSSVAVSGENLLLRGVDHLYCIANQTSPKQERSRTVSNKEKAIAVLKSLQSRDKTVALEHISAEKYIQHNLAAPDGREGFLGLFEIPNVQFKVNVIRTFEDDNYVFTHSEYDFFGPKIGFDIFRFEGDRIVEHWDNLQEVTTETVSGRSQTDGPTEPKDLDKTKENKKLVEGFVNDVLLGKNPGKITDYISIEMYHQHNPHVADGLDGLGKALKELADAGMPMTYAKNHLILGQGNFILTVSEGVFMKKNVAFYDLFRVENGKIVEHWDAIEEIPAKEDWKNDNGKF